MRGLSPIWWSVNDGTGERDLELPARSPTWDTGLPDVLAGGGRGG
jgi:hypothetical protein